jgi:drug/metabolite transporter (DMT)-like permease
MSLEPHWIGLLLLAAIIHASWNALNKASRDPLLSMMTLTASGGLAAGCLIPFVPPLDPAAWPWLATSALLHFVYQLSLVSAYRLGDLSQVYPIARGVAPIGVALLAAITAHEVPSPLGAIGLAIAAGAIMSLAIVGGRGISSHRAVLAALQTALIISLYTVVDGHGVRSTPTGLSYIVWMSFVDCFPIIAVALIRRRGQVLDFLRSDGPRNIAGGMLATLGYSIVMAAMAHGAMASVAALRETSVIFAALIGTRLLGEPFGGLRILASITLAGGLVMLQTG